jgi:hypothetical protein
MLAVPDPDAPAMMDRHPRGAGGRVDQGVEEGPIGDRIGAVVL